jgi:hypothetical protein
MAVQEIKDGDQVLARHIPADTAWQSGLNFYSKSDEYLQVGVWGYGSGIRLPGHIHRSLRREALRTQEVIFVRQGRIRAAIYTDAGEEVAQLELAAGDILLLLGGGHGYEILEDRTEVLEIKNGPYAGPELDRRRI